MTEIPEADLETGEPARQRRRVRPASISVAALVVGLVAALIFTGLGWRDAERQKDAAGAARTKALSAARADAVIIASYDYRELDAYFDAVEEIATGDFADQYDEANGNLRRVLVKTKAVVEAKVVEAGIVSSSEDEAVVVLFVDQVVRNVTTRGTATDRNRMLMKLERDDDRWLVSDLELK